MNHKVLIIIFLPLFVLFSCGKEQVATDQVNSFIKFFGQTKNTSGSDVKQLSDGTYIVIGTTTSDKGGTDMYLLKSDKYGNEIWHKSIGIDSLTENGRSIEVLADGFILAGNITNKKGIKNIFLAKTNTNGDTLWTKTIGGDSSLVANSIHINSNGSYAIAGSITFPNNTYSNGLLLLLNETGNVKLLMNSEASNTVFNSVTENETYYVTVGTSNSSGVAFYTKKTNNLRTIYTYTPLTSSTGKSIKMLSDGSFIAIGTAASTEAGNQISLSKLTFDASNSLVETWEKKIGTSNDDLGNDIEVISDNEFAVIGTTTLSDGSEDIIFMKTDGTGKQVGEPVIYGATGNQTGDAITNTSDGGFVLTGTNEYSGNSVLTLIKTINDGKLKEE